MPPEIVQNQIPEAVNRITGAGLGTTLLGSGWIWLGNNQSSIAAFCTIVAMLVTVYGVFRGKK
jgi:hypothetical protein